MSLSVNNPTFKEVRNHDTGLIISVESIFDTTEENVSQLRMQLEEANTLNESILVCPVCGTNLLIRSYGVKHGSSLKSFYFRHSNEDGDCPIKTKGHYSEDEINAMKYNGAKESSNHKAIKNIIKNSLSADHNFSDIKVEKVFKGQERKKWRKPDVQATYMGKVKVAFEIQLSTTFVSVIAQRRMFYKDNDAIICWVFQSYKEINAHMMQEDIFFNNNNNLFLASPNTLEESISSHEFILDCHWTRPSYNSEGKLTNSWESKLVPFSDLNLDIEKQRVFLFDYEKAKETITEQLIINAERKSKQEAYTSTAIDSLRKDFYKWWKHNHGELTSGANYNQFRNRFKLIDIHLEEFAPNYLVRLLKVIYAVQKDTIDGFSYNTLIQVAHSVSEHPGENYELLMRFRVALLVYEKAQQIRNEDTSKKWIRKTRQYRLKFEPKHYLRGKRYDDLLTILFPEIMNPIHWEELEEIDNKFKRLA